MRLTFLLLLSICLPLRAGDSSLLRRAVDAFAHDDRGVRDDASRRVRQYIQVQLAPLLTAMKSEDPEVRRRATAALAGFLPEREETTESFIPGAVLNKGGWVQFAQGGGQIRFWVQGVNGQLIIQGDQGKTQKRIAEIKKFGITGYPCAQQLLRKQLGLAAGRGYVAAQILKRSPASRIGLRPLDIILAIDGKPVMQVDSLHRALGNHADWTKRTMRVMRAGKVVTVSANR